jgi:hypothetical protein
MIQAAAAIAAVGPTLTAVPIAIDVKIKIVTAPLDEWGCMFALSRMVFSGPRDGLNPNDLYTWIEGEGWVETDESYRRRLTAYIARGNPNNVAPA